MKKFNQLILACTMAVACSSAFADSVLIEVKGTINPTACSAAFSNGGTFEYGTIDKKILKNSDSTRIGQRDATLTITCDAPTKIAVKGMDNRPGTSPFSDSVEFLDSRAYIVSRHYGLGTAGSKKIGAYILKFDPASFKADDHSVHLVQSVNGAPWGSNIGVLTNNGADLLSWSASDAFAAPMSATVFSATLDLLTVIDKASDLDMSGAIHLDGSATLSIVYL